MKNWKHYEIISFMLILVLSFIFITCEKNNDPVLCNCEIKEHLGINETCCGGDDCNCSEQIVALEGTEINIRKMNNVTVEQMNTSVNFITDYFNNKIVEIDQNKIIMEITEIHIIPSSNPELYKANKNGTIWIIDLDATKDDLDLSLVFKFE